MSITVNFSKSSNLQTWAFTAVINSEKAIDSLTPAQKNLDVVRALLTKSASSQGLKCEVVALTSDKNFNIWQAYYSNNCGVSTLVAEITESDISKGSIPKLCPMCGKPNADPPGTNAHNVVSAAIWRAVFDEVFILIFASYLVAPTPQKTIDGTKDLLESLKKVGSSTARSSVIGAATQGDRRTCKGCELIHGPLSLLQRDNAIRSLSHEPLAPHYQKSNKGSKELIGYLHSIPKDFALGIEFGGIEGGSVFGRDILEEITRQRIEDVIRGVANEIYSQKYRDPNNHAKLRDGYECMEIFNDTIKYYAFLDLIRTKAFEKAGSKPADAAHESHFIEKIKKIEFIQVKK